MAVRVSEVVKAARRTDLIVTPRLNQWLVQHGDDAIPQWVVDIIAEELRKKPRDRSGSFSASSSGRCLREQELQYVGAQPEGAIEPRLANIFDDGKWRHLRWQAMGLQVPFLERIEMSLRWKKKRGYGTIDGLGIVPDDHPRNIYRGLEYGFELKGVNPFGYQKAVKQEADTKEEHKRQVARYFLMGGFDLFVTIYENKATQEWFEWVEWPDDKYLEEEQEELDQLNDAVEKKHMHDMLHQCKMHTGLFHECQFGGAQGPCARAGKWPRLGKGKK
jgi:hypothetical protein